MAEDELCTHKPGEIGADRVAQLQGVDRLDYGEKPEAELKWSSAAKERIERVPIFVRAMVIKSVESHCRKLGKSEVTAEELEALRAKMPVKRFFPGTSSGS